MQCKDIQLCYDMAKETRTPIEFLGRMQQIYHRAQYQVSLMTCVITNLVSMLCDNQSQLKLVKEATLR